MSGPKERSVTAAALANALLAVDAEERRQATSRVAELDRKEALPLLLSALADSDWRVRKEATIAARSFLPDRVLIDALIRALGEASDVGLRNAAVEVLASAGHAAVGPIEDAMSSLDIDGRKLAVDALGRSRDPGALGPLEAALFDLDDNVRQAAVEAIAVIGAVAGDSAQKILIRCLSEEDRFVRLAALEGLNHLGVSVPWSRIEPLLNDPTSRAAALSAAAFAEHPKAPKALAKALVSSRGGAFSQALGALARLAEGSLAPRVADAIRAQGRELGARLLEVAEGKDPDLDHLRAAALTLAAIARVDGVIFAAIRALSEQSLAPQAAHALAVIGADALPALVEQITRPGDDTGGARAAAIDAAAAIAIERQASQAAPPIELLGALRQAALDDDKDVATSALYALSHLGSEPDLALAADRAASTSLPIASAAECALYSLTGRLHKEARSLAEQLMKRHPFSVAAAIILGALGSAGALDPEAMQAEIAFLSSCASGGDARARRAAVMAVAEIGGVFSTDVLSFALADEEHDVQLAAARALGRVICVDPAASRFLDAAPPSAIPSSRSGGMSAPRASATDVLDLIGRSGDDDLVAAAVNALGEGMTSWKPPSIPPPSSASGGAAYPSLAPPGRSLRPSMIPGDDLIAALSPLAKKAPSAVAIAAVDALSRAPLGTPGREPALLGALHHPDPAVTKAAMLKIERTSPALEKIARCLDHASRDVRLLAAEMLAGSAPPSSKDWLRKRATVEIDPDVRVAIERALAHPSAREGEASGP